MYKLWYCELKKPLVLSLEQLRVYVQMMRAVNMGTPRWEKVEDDYCI